MVQPPGTASPRPISGVSIEDREMDGQTDAQPGGWVNLQEGFISDDKSHYMHGGEGGEGEGDLSAVLRTAKLSFCLFRMASFLPSFWKCHGTAMAGPA